MQESYQICSLNNLTSVQKCPNLQEFWKHDGNMSAACWYYVGRLWVGYEQVNIEYILCTAWQQVGKSIYKKQKLFSFHLKKNMYRPFFLLFLISWLEHYYKRKRLALQIMEIYKRGPMNDINYITITILHFNLVGDQQIPLNEVV